MFTFDAEIKRLEGKIKWSVVFFPNDAAKQLGAGGNIPVRVTVDGHSFDHMLLPSKNGHYFVFNEFIKRAVGKQCGDTVHVELEKDTKKRELLIPDYIEDALQNAGMLKRFLRQPNYSKREQINHIELAKKDETKENRLRTLVKRLEEEQNSTTTG